MNIKGVICAFTVVEVIFEYTGCTIKNYRGHNWKLQGIRFEYTGDNRGIYLSLYVKIQGLICEHTGDKT